jgi:hypothetical protein
MSDYASYFNPLKQYPVSILLSNKDIYDLQVQQVLSLMKLSISDLTLLYQKMYDTSMIYTKKNLAIKKKKIEEKNKKQQASKQITEETENPYNEEEEEKQYLLDFICICSLLGKRKLALDTAFSLQQIPLIAFAVLKSLSKVTFNLYKSVKEVENLTKRLPFACYFAHHNDLDRLMDVLNYTSLEFDYEITNPGFKHPLISAFIHKNLHMIQYLLKYERDRLHRKYSNGLWYSLPNYLQERLRLKTCIPELIVKLFKNLIKRQDRTYLHLLLPEIYYLLKHKKEEHLESIESKEEVLMWSSMSDNNEKQLYSFIHLSEQELLNGFEHLVDIVTNNVFMNRYYVPLFEFYFNEYSLLTNVEKLDEILFKLIPVYRSRQERRQMLTLLFSKGFKPSQKLFGLLFEKESWKIVASYVKHYHGELMYCHPASRLLLLDELNIKSQSNHHHHQCRIHHLLQQRKKDVHSQLYDYTSLPTVLIDFVNEY